MSNKKETTKEEVTVKTVDNTTVKKEGDFKVKSVKKIKNLGENKTQDIIKVDLSKNKKEESDAIQTQKTDDSNVIIEEQKNSSNGKEVVENVRTTDKEIDSPIQEIKDEDSDIDESRVEAVDENTTASQEQKEIPKEVETQKLPENIDKLIKFMKETGGNVQDYARLNADYTNINDDALLHEYYKAARPHLNSEERSFVIEDSFSFDTELDEARDIRKKKLAYKEEVAKAKNYLEDLKGKYYDEIKLRPGVTQEQQKATDFFNRYNEEQEVNNAKHERFVTQTKELLNNDFKGFDFKLGDKKFRYGIKDPSTVANNQADIGNFIKTFLNKKGEISNTQGYHKALYAAQNADTIANHFYEQGKTDAIKDQLAKSKNINTEPRATTSGDSFINGFKVKAMSGLDSSKLKIKKKILN